MRERERERERGRSISKVNFGNRISGGNNFEEILKDWKK